MIEYDKIVSPEDFCGREQEVARLTALVSNKSNVMLTGDRRYGKTSLIQKVFAELPDNILTIYADLYSVVDELDVAKELYTAVEKATPNTLRKQTGKLIDLFSKLNGVDFMPSKSGDSFTFKPSFKSDDIDDLLGSAFSLIDSYVKHSDSSQAVIALDEFQQVGLIKKVKLDAKLRAISQNNKNISFIFSGSRKTMLNKLMNAPKQPWWQMTTPIHVAGIDVSLLKQYCETKMARTFEAQAFESAYDRFRGQTRLILNLCFNLCIHQQKVISFQAVDRMIEQMVDEHNSDFTEKFFMFTAQQKKALKAIASASTGGLYEKENLKLHNLTKQGLRQATISLEKIDEIQKVDEGKYQFTNVLFGMWLIKQYPT